MTKGSLHQWPLWGTSEIPELNFFKLNWISPKISKTEWYVCFNGYFEASKHYQEPKIASLKIRF